MEPTSIINMKYIVEAILFSVIGLLSLAVSFKVFDRLTPGDLWHEIIANKNVALAITAGAMVLAMALIISAAIHG